MPITPIVSVIGLTTSAGVLSRIVDGDEGNGWTPAATRLTALTDTFTDVAGAPNVGKAFACLQFDFGAATRVPLFLVQVQSAFTLGDCMLIGSDNPATVTTNVVQTGDVLLGLYPRHEIVAGAILVTAMKAANFAKRYIRMCFHATGALMTPDGTPTDTGGSSDTAVWFDTGSGNWEATFPDNTNFLTIEGWGGGASGGETATANDGGDTTCSTFSLTAHGGDKSAVTTPNSGAPAAPGGTASGGNIENTTGGPGGLPSPGNASEGLSGKGGDSPHGGLGGPATISTVAELGFKAGIDGAAPGGGGSGRTVFTSSAGGQFYKYQGGAAGGYFKHELTVGVSGDVQAGDLIAYSVGDGGVSTQANGRGAQGRIKFTWRT